MNIEVWKIKVTRSYRKLNIIYIKIEKQSISLYSHRLQDHIKEWFDSWVYHLYGLTCDEELIVNPQTPITREEYERTELE